MAESFEQQQARWRDEITATPTPQIGDWVRDWAPDSPLIRWRQRDVTRLAKHPQMYRYISEIRRGDGFVWRRGCGSCGQKTHRCEDMSIDAARSAFMDVVAKRGE